MTTLPASIPGLLLDMHPQARGLIESGLARSFERLGRAAEVAALLSSLPDAPTFGDKEYSLNPSWGDRSEMMASKVGYYHLPNDGPNAGRRVPPPSRQWWTTQYKGKGTPGLGCQRRDKAKSKAQKAARRKNR